AEIRGALASPAPAHRVEPPAWLEGPDQDRGRRAVRLADEVETGVDAVRAVDGGTSGRPEERRGSLGQSDVRVAGWIVALIALRLDDRAADAVEEEGAADQLAGHRVDAAVEESFLQQVGHSLAPRSAAR